MVGKRKKHLIIVIEGKRISGCRIKQALGADKYEIVEASTPHQAIKDIARSGPSLVLISTEYGVKPVYSFCMKLAMRGFGLIILHDRPTRNEVVKATRYGALDLMLRPPMPGTIKQRIERALVKCGKLLPESNKKNLLDIPDNLREPGKRVEFMIKKVEEVLALPHAVSTVLRLSSRPDTSASHLVPPVESDAAISSTIMRRANSVASGSAHRIDSIRDAVARLGMKETTNIVMTQSVFKMFEKDGDTFGFDRTEYWIHVLGAACCARSLAPFMTGISADDAFLAALLHDIGKMLFDEYLSDEFQQAVKEANIDCNPIRKGENKIFGIDHSYVGSQIGEQWELPEYLNYAITNHHKYEVLMKGKDGDSEEVKRNREIAKCVCLANQLAKAFGFGCGGDYIVEAKALDLWEGIVCDKIDFQNLHKIIRDALRGYLDMLGIPLADVGLGSEGKIDKTVLLFFPVEGPQYQILIEAYFARLGMETKVVQNLEDASKDKKEYDYCLTSVSGKMEDVKGAAEKIAPLAKHGIVLANCKDVPKEGLEISSNSMAVREQLDFHTLEEAADKLLSNSEASDQ